METENINVKIGANLRRLRTNRGWSAEYAGEQMDLTASSIHNYEAGRRKITPELIMKAAEILNCSILDIFYGPDENGKELNVLSPESSKIMRYLATDWDGNIEALVTFMGLVAMLPPEERREIYMIVTITKDRLLHAGTIRAEDLPKNLAYMEEQLGKLFEG